LDFRAATPLTRRTLIIIPTDTIGARTFTTILIPLRIRIITAARPMGIAGTGHTTVTIAIIITTATELRDDGS
jgi:hypothetical protein